MPLSLTSLPAELLYLIHVYDASPTLPLVSSHLATLFSASPSSHRAAYLIARHPRSTLSHAVKYPICDLPVIRALERQSKRPLKCPELPRRLAKSLAASTGPEADLPLIMYLLQTYGASPNSHGGYFLARAVFAKCLPLVNLLLSYGADPGLKKGWAVVAAVGHGDISLVKLLLERESGETGGETDYIEREGGKKRSPGGEGGARKRRKMEERCRATSEMLEAAVKNQKWAIVDYLTARGEEDCTGRLVECWADVVVVLQVHCRIWRLSRCCKITEIPRSLTPSSLVPPL